MSFESRISDLKKQAGKLLDEGSDFFDDAAPELVRKRRTVCFNCPSQALLHDSGSPEFWRCNECGCFIYPKTALNSQSCPKDYW